MDCSKCGTEVAEGSCTCQECKAPMTCADGKCTCECGASVEEKDCSCVECA